jgi:hypothetical protein
MAALNLESVFTQPERCLGPGVIFEGAHEGMMGIEPRRDCAPTARTGRGSFIGRLLAAELMHLPAVGLGISAAAAGRRAVTPGR